MLNLQKVNCKLLLYALCTVTLMLTACAPHYQIDGTTSVSLLDGKKLFIKVFDGDKWADMDSTEIIHNAFSFEGAFNDIELASLFMDNTSIIPFIIEKGQLNINIDNAHVVLNGTPLNDKLYRFINQKSMIEEKIMRLDSEESQLIMAGFDPDRAQMQIGEKYHQYSREMGTLVKNFVQDNYDNILGPSVFLFLCCERYHPDFYSLMEETLTQAPEGFRKHPYLRNVVITHQKKRGGYTEQEYAPYIHGVVK